MSRVCGRPIVAYVTVVTSVHADMPPPDRTGLGTALLELCAITATVISALAAGLMVAVVLFIAGVRRPKEAAQAREARLIRMCDENPSHPPSDQNSRAPADPDDITHCH